MPFHTHAGVTLRYDRAGSGPALLLIHGWTGNRTFWERQVQALRDRFTVVTVDLRGHGESSRPRAGYTIAAMAADLEQLVRGLGLSRVALVGWSMGGLVAAELARRLGERATHLALVCTTAGGLSDPANADADPVASAGMRAEIAADFRAFARRFAPKLFKDGDASPLASWAAAQLQKTPAHVAVACFDALLAADLRRQLPELRVPAAILHGRHDVLLPLAHGETLARLVPDAALTVFEESGHSPLLEEPEAFNAALATLLARSAAVAPPAPGAKAKRGAARK